MSGPVIDRGAVDRLLSVIGGNRADLLELLDEFFLTGPDNLRRMEAAAASGDLNTLRIAAHSLKSNGRDFGAVDLAGICEGIERACKAGSLDDAPGQVAAAREAFAAASVGLKRMLAGDG